MFWNNEPSDTGVFAASSHIPKLWNHMHRLSLFLIATNDLSDLVIYMLIWVRGWTFNLAIELAVGVRDFTKMIWWWFWSSRGTPPPTLRQEIYFKIILLAYSDFPNLYQKVGRQRSHHPEPKYRASWDEGWGQEVQDVRVQKSRFAGAEVATGPVFPWRWYIYIGASRRQPVLPAAERLS